MLHTNLVEAILQSRFPEYLGLWKLAETNSYHIFVFVR